MPKYLDYHGLQTFKDDLDIEFAKKVDKEAGKGLSTNDYTNTEKQKVADALVAADIAGKLDSTLKGAANGLAELDNAGKVPASQLPSYVDDVLEYASLSTFPATGESGKIYVAKDTNKTYRWSGSGYVEISQGLTLGTTSSTAFRGDYGQAAYTHGVTNKGAAFTSGLYKITTNAEGHVTAASTVQKSDITGLGIPGSVPTNVSAFTNDAGYLTQHQDISGKIDVTEKGAANGVAELNANGIVPSDQLPANISAFYNDAGYLTQHQDISGKIDATEKGVANGVASLDSSGKVPSSQLPAGQTTVSKIMMNSTEMPMDSSGVVDLGTVIIQHQDISGKVSVSEKGAANGVAELDVNGKVPSSQLPSYVDDVEEYSSVSAFPATGESGKVYVAQDTNVTYRWSGTEYVVIGSDLALGETASTAYRGDRGAAAYAAAVTNVESAPSSGSSNLITSGGVYDALPDVMTGATSSAAGASGLVPAPASGDNTKYLKGDGSWGTIVADPFTGATSSTAGTIGMVPAPSAGDQAKYLKADGTWGTVIADPFTGATASTAGTTGMVPAPAAGDQMRVLTGGGTWEASPGAKLYTTDSLTVTNVSGSYSQTFLDENIGVDMQAVKLEVEDESVFNANITVTPANGSVTVACSDVSGTTTMKISLLKVIEDPTAVTSTEFTILNNRLLAVENVCTDTPVTIAVSDWSSSSPYTYTWESNLVTAASKIDVLLEDGSENAGIESFDFDRVIGGVQFTTSVLPTGNLPVTIRVVNAKIDENYGLTGANVATSVISGQTNVDGALSALNSSVLALNNKIATTIISSQTSIVALAGTVESGETRKFFVDNASSTLTDYPASMTSYGAVRYCQITIERISSVKAVRITAVTQGGASASIAGEVIGSSVYWEASPAVINSKIANNYTDYNSAGDYHIRVCQSGKMVTVSGEIIGTGATGYIEAVNLPSPFAYDSNETGKANAVVFLARNQATGAYQQIRCGGDFKIYRESAMTNGQWYAFGFSYCKA